MHLDSSGLQHDFAAEEIRKAEVTEGKLSFVFERKGEKYLKAKELRYDSIVLGKREKGIISVNICFMNVNVQKKI